MKKLILTLFLFTSVLTPGLAFNSNFAYAEDLPQDKFELTVAVENPLCDSKGQNCKKDVKDILSAILKTIVDIALPIVIVMVIYSGFLYVLARGRPEAIETAHKTLTWTLIGAAILLGAQLIATVLVDTVSNIAKDSGVNTQKTTSTTSSTGATTAGSVTAGSTTGGSSSAGTTTGTTTGGMTSGNTTAGTNTNNTGGATGGSSSFNSYPNESDPINPTDILDNSKITLKINSFSPGLISYYLTTTAGVDGVGMHCVDGHGGSATSWFTEIKSVLNNELITKEIGTDSGVNYQCAGEYSITSNTGKYYITKSFPLKEGASNK